MVGIFFKIKTQIYIDFQINAFKVDSQGGIFGLRGLGHKKDPIELYDATNTLFKRLDIPFGTDNTTEDLRQLIC